MVHPFYAPPPSPGNACTRARVSVAGQQAASDVLTALINRALHVRVASVIFQRASVPMLVTGRQQPAFDRDRNRRRGIGCERPYLTMAVCAGWRRADRLMRASHRGAGGTYTLVRKHVHAHE